MISSRVQVVRGSAAALLMLAVASPAQAGLGKFLVRNLTYALSPSIGEVQNGPNSNDNLLTQRFNYDPVTDGRSFEFFRTWGDDSYGNPDTLNLGFLNVQLRQPDGTGLRGAGVYSRVGYNRQLVPEVYWDLRTTGRNVASFAGAAAVATPLQYRVQANNGLESATLAGQILVNSAGSVNALGFYNVNLSVSNTGTLTSDGVAGDRNQDVSFDVGPVNLSGNIFVDQVVALVDVLSEQFLGVPPDQFNPLTLRGKTADDVSAAIAAGEAVTAPELAALLAAHFEDPDSVALPRSPFDTNQTTDAVGTAILTHAQQGTVPEPGTLGLILLGAALTRVRRVH